MANQIPQNPHNNTPPVLLNEDNYADPYEMAILMKNKAGVPTEILDRVHTDLEDLTKNSWLGFIDQYQMHIGFDTEYVQFTESTSPDYVVRDGVTRNGDDFTIDWTQVQGWEVGQDSFFYRVDDVVAIYDDNGNKEMGVITAIDKANNTFTAKCRNGASWTIPTTDITIDVNGSDHDRGSCGPDGLLELRKTKSVVAKLQEIKEAIKTRGNKKYKMCIDKDTTKWYPDNLVRVRKALNIKVAKTLLNDIESKDGSGAHGIGKYGSKGLFQNLSENSFVNDGYITDVAGVKALTSYWDSLGLAGRTMIAHVNSTQYDYFEAIAVEYANLMGITLQVVMSNSEDNYMKFGFNSITISGYTIKFTKWDLTTGNSPFGETRISANMPKGIIMPTGTVQTKINGVARNVPYIFKMFLNKELMPGMVRQFFTGGFAKGNGSDCEYLKLTLSTTVALAVPAPEALTLIQ